MKSIIFTLLILVFLSDPTAAQQQYGIHGRAVATDKTPLPFNIIRLVNISDSTSNFNTLTDSVGHFNFQNVPLGKYYLLSVSPDCNRKNEIEHRNEDTDLGDLVFPCAVKLKDVEIVHKTPLLEHKVDRMVFNVKNSILASTGSLWDALRTTPSVRTTPGGISVGDKSATIYMDNIQLQLSGDDLINFLKAYSASNVDKIEVFMIPPSNYDAVGGSVINVVSKKNKRDGIFGDIGIGIEQNSYGKYNTAFNLNGKRPKLEYFLNVSGGYGKYRSTNDEYIIYESSAAASNWSIQESNLEKRKSYVLKGGAKYLINKTNSIGVQLNYSNINSDVNGVINSNVASRNTVDSILVTSSTFLSNRKIFSATEYYRLVLDSLDGSLTISATQLWYSNPPSQSMSAITYDTDMKPINLYANSTYSPQDIDLSTWQIDLSKIVEKITVDAGGKLSFIKNINNWNFSESSLKLLNDFTYKENNYAAYISLTRQWKKITGKIGLRAEYTNLKIRSQTSATDSIITQDYLKLFPTAYIQYDINADNLLIISATRRINRPDYYRLNPFTYYKTPYYTTSGNPYLKPSLDYSTQLDYVLKNNYTFSAFYNFSTDKFTNISQQDNDTHAIKDMQQNIGKSTSLGVSFMMGIEPIKGWQINTYVRFSRKTESSNYLNNEYKFKKYIAYLSLDNAFDLSKNRSWSGEVHFYYLTPTIQGIYQNDKMYNVSLGLRKKISEFTVALTVNDLLFSDFNKIDVNYLDQRNGFIYKTDSRGVALQLKYSFNRRKGKNKDVRFEAPENTSEKDRINMN